MLARRHVIPFGVFALFAAVAPVLAGPPLLCHPFDIGDARSLPWGPDWSQGRSEYNVANLVAGRDTGCWYRRDRLNRSCGRNGCSRRWFGNDGSATQQRAKTASQSRF